MHLNKPLKSLLGNKTENLAKENGGKKYGCRDKQDPGATPWDFFLTTPSRLSENLGNTSFLLLNITGQRSISSGIFRSAWYFEDVRIYQIR